MGHPYGDDYHFDWHADHITKRNRRLHTERELCRVRRHDQLMMMLSTAAVAVLTLVIGFVAVRSLFLLLGY
jgi:hypothetical protein